MQPISASECNILILVGTNTQAQLQRSKAAGGSNGARASLLDARSSCCCSMRSNTPPLQHRCRPRLLYSAPVTHCFACHAYKYRCLQQCAHQDASGEQRSSARAGTEPNSTGIEHDSIYSLVGSGGWSLGLRARNLRAQASSSWSRCCRERHNSMRVRRKPRPTSHGTSYASRTSCVTPAR